MDPFRDVLSVVATCEGGKSYALRTAMAFGVLEFPQTLPPRLRAGEKLANAAGYLTSGQYGTLGRKLLQFVAGQIIRTDRVNY